MKEYISFLLYFAGNIISYPMVYFDLGWLYPIYHWLMSKSVDYDINGRFWKYTEEDRISCDYEYAKDLATHIWREFYSKESPDWEPLDDLFGVLTQIDNMVSGLSWESGQQRLIEQCDVINGIYIIPAEVVRKILTAT